LRQYPAAGGYPDPAYPGNNTPGDNYHLDLTPFPVLTEALPGLVAPPCFFR
jgi:hypothetical protein